MAKTDLDAVNFPKDVQDMNNFISDTLESLSKRLSNLATKVTILENELENARRIIQQKDIEIKHITTNSSQEKTVHIDAGNDFSSIKENLDFLSKKFESLEQKANTDIELLKKQNIESKNIADTKIQELENILTDRQKINLELEAELKNSKTEKVALREKISILESEKESLLKEQNSGLTLDDKLQKANQEISFLKTEIIELKDEKNNTQEEIQVYEEQISEFNTKIQDLLKKIDQLEAQNAELTMKYLTKEQNELKSGLKSAEEEISILDAHVESQNMIIEEKKYQDKIYNLEKIIQEQKLQLEVEKNKQDEYTRLMDWKNRVIELENILKIKETTLNEQKIEIEAYKHKQQTLDDLKEWKNRTNELENSLANRDQIISNLKIKLEDLESKHKNLEKLQQWKDRVIVLENILSDRNKVINELKIEIENKENEIQSFKAHLIELSSTTPKNVIEQDIQTSKLTNAVIVEDLRMQISELEQLLIETQNELTLAKKNITTERYSVRRKDLVNQPNSEEDEEGQVFDDGSGPELSIKDYKKHIKTLQQEIRNLENDLEDSDDELEETEDQITKLKENNEFLKTELETKEKLFEKRNAQLEVMANEFEVLRRQLEATDNTKTIEGLNEALKLTESALQQAKTQISQTTEQVKAEEELQTILEEKNKQIEELQSQIKTKETKIDELEESSIQDQGRIAKLESSLIRLKEENKQLKSKLT